MLKSILRSFFNKNHASNLQKQSASKNNTPYGILLDRYMINICPRDMYRDDGDVYSFSGKLLAPHAEKAQIPSVDIKTFVSIWNKACPVSKPGEKWVCFTEDSEIPLAIVERFSADNYKIKTVNNQSWFNPYSVINLLKLSETLVPIPDTERGCWKIDLPTGLRQHTASLYVEYISHTICFTYESCVSEEVGPMGHYEDDNYTGKEQHEEGEFSGRDQMIRCLIAFVKSMPPGHRVFIDDDQLHELVSYSIAFPTEIIKNAGENKLDSWEKYVEYYKKYYIGKKDQNRIISKHLEPVHITKLEDFISIGQLVNKCSSIDGFVEGISKEMSKAGLKINKERNDEKINKGASWSEDFTFFAYYIDSSKPYLISPEEAAWFYLLLHKEKAEELLNSSEMDRLNNLLSADSDTVFDNKDGIPESCMSKLLMHRLMFVDPECTVFDWEQAISRAIQNGDRKHRLADLYSYHMGCSKETALKETEKVISKLVDPKLKACYPEWEADIVLGGIVMCKQFRQWCPEKWLGFVHPFFSAHSVNPAVSAKQYYELYSPDWRFPYELYGIIDRIDSYQKDRDTMEETSNKLVLYHKEGVVSNYENSEMLSFEFVAENPDDIPINTDDCGVPCKGWYDKNGQRFLIDPLGMNGLFEFRDTSLKRP